MMPLPRQRRRRRQPTRNSTRDRETTELRALRLLVDELATHRSSLLAFPSRAPSLMSPPAHRSVWRRLAERQAAARESAQRENRALLRQVQRRADWIERLWRLLLETRSDDLVEETRVYCRLSRDLAIVAELKQRGVRGACFATALDVVTAEGVALIDTHEDRWTTTRDVEGSVAKLVSVRQLPFDAYTTTQALWSVLTVVAGKTVDQARRVPMEEMAPLPCYDLAYLERSSSACAMKYATAKREDSVRRLDYHAVVQTIDRDDGPNAWLEYAFLWQSSCRSATTGGQGTDSMYLVVSSNSSHCTGAPLTSTIAIVATSHVPSRDKLLLDEMARMMEVSVTLTLDVVENVLMDGVVGEQPAVLGGAADVDVVLV